MARQGDILFYRQPTVDPAAIDRLRPLRRAVRAGRHGTLALAVQKREASALAMSDVVLVDHAEAVPTDQRDPSNPLYLGTTLIYPSLGTPITRSKRGSLVFFFTARAGKRPLTGRVELVQDGGSSPPARCRCRRPMTPAWCSTPTSCPSTRSARGHTS